MVNSTAHAVPSTPGRRASVPPCKLLLELTGAQQRRPELAGLGPCPFQPVCSLPTQRRPHPAPGRHCTNLCLRVEIRYGRSHDPPFVVSHFLIWRLLLTRLESPKTLISAVVTSHTSSSMQGNHLVCLQNLSGLAVFLPFWSFPKTQEFCW